MHLISIILRGGGTIFGLRDMIEKTHKNNKNKKLNK